MYRQALLVALILSVAAGTAQGQESATQKGDSLQADSSGVSATAASVLQRPLPPWLLRPPGIQALAAEPPDDLSLNLPTLNQGPSFFDALSAALAMKMTCGEDELCRSDLERGFERSHGRMPLGADLVAELLADFVAGEDRLRDPYSRRRWKNWP